MDQIRVFPESLKTVRCYRREKFGRTSSALLHVLQIIRISDTGMYRLSAHSNIILLQTGRILRRRVRENEMEGRGGETCIDNRDGITRFQYWRALRGGRGHAALVADVESRKAYSLRSAQSSS
jgi:hypothetical protein